MKISIIFADSMMRDKRKLYAVILLLLFGCYYSSISLFSHTHIAHGTSVVHSHLGGETDHEHSDAQYAVIDILSNFQSECAVAFYGISVPFVLLTESYTGYEAPSHLEQVYSVLKLRGPPQA